MNVVTWQNKTILTCFNHQSVHIILLASAISKRSTSILAVMRISQQIAQNGVLYLTEIERRKNHFQSKGRNLKNFLFRYSKQISHGRYRLKQAFILLLPQEQNLYNYKS